MGSRNTEGAVLSYSILWIPRALVFCGVVRRVLVALLLVLVGAGRPLVAQAGVTANRDLQFGAVTRGIPSAVPPSDPIKSGQWTITAPAGTKVQLRITEPNSLIGPGSATMPFTVGNNEAFVQAPAGSPGFFNPSGHLNFTFSGTTTAIVRLGGRVSPGAAQASGPYANTVILEMRILN
jgi:hypothetical protein